MYVTPEIQIIAIEAQDILTSSRDDNKTPDDEL